MRNVSISELKASLSEYLKIVRTGEDVVITDRGNPVARIVKMEGVRKEDERRVRLARQGIVGLRKGRLRNVTVPPGKAPSGVLAALLEERAEGE